MSVDLELVSQLDRIKQNATHDRVERDLLKRENGELKLDLGRVN